MRERGADIRERAFTFVFRIVKLREHLIDKSGAARTLAAQLLRSGASIGANLEEADAGHSRVTSFASAR